MLAWELETSLTEVLQGEVVSCKPPRSWRPWIFGKETALISDLDVRTVGAPLLVPWLCGVGEKVCSPQSPHFLIPDRSGAWSRFRNPGAAPTRGGLSAWTEGRGPGRLPHPGAAQERGEWQLHTLRCHATYRQETQSHGMAVAPAWARRSSPPLLTLLLLLLLRMSPCSSMVAQDPRAAALSLHPPYFNLAQAARIWATATCGERGPEVARPRPELYCKLVGGPTAQGSSHTIQVWSPRVAGIGSKVVISSLYGPVTVAKDGSSFPHTS